MIHRGVATFTLDYGTCPRWLFERMVKLGRQILALIIQEFGPDEFIRRIADPVWFQSLGTVLAFDWNASGLTTILTAALKEAVRTNAKNWGLFICGGKGKTSRKTPNEIVNWGGKLGLPEAQINKLVYNSKMAAKVDSALVQDAFQLYHHSFFFSQSGAWAVVQQGMNIFYQTARRYHWYSESLQDLICEPHSGIASQVKVPVLDLTSRISTDNRNISRDLVNSSYNSLIKDVQILRKYSSELSQMIAVRHKESGTNLTLLNLKNTEFHWHKVATEKLFESRYLKKILWQVCEVKPKTYENLLALKGVGAKTIRALSLVAEVIYGAKPSYEDPARYSFAFGGKDGTPFPVDRITYDETIDFFRRIIQRLNISFSEKRFLFSKLDRISISHKNI